MITQREYLRRCAYREFPTIGPEQVENYLRQLEKEHPEWDMSLKVNADSGMA